jgi:hypothetical protein
MKKQSEAAKTFLMGHDPDKEQKRHPLWEGWTKEFRTRWGQMDDPVRHERLAAIGKNGTQIRLHKKDDVLFREPF